MIPAKGDLLKDVSIIIPVWNAVEFLPICFDSIVSQTWDHSRIEVILIDDGSTDGSGALCDDYARKHPMFSVYHQENTGGPSAPRNRGIEVATGEFIFFCDNDDYFGPEAVERMVGHAHAWESDILLAKMGQVGGRDIPRQVFKQEQPKADLYTSAVTSTLGPWKLYRRSLIADNGIRFPEDCTFDDSVFTLHAMLLAKTISVANDYEYYYWVLRSDGGNITTGATESAWHQMDRRFLGLQRLFGLVDELADHEAAELNLLPKLIREPMAATVRRLTKYDREEADKWAGELRSLLRPHYSPKVADQIRFDLQLMYAILMQTDDSEGLCKMTKTMPVVPEGVRFVEEEGKILCEYVTESKHPVLVRAEIGPRTLQSVLTFKNVLTTSEWEHGTLALEGELTLRSGRPLVGTKLEIRIQNYLAKDRAHVMSVDVSDSSEQASAGGRITTTVLQWRSVVSRDVLEAISLETDRSGKPDARHRWDFDLIVRVHGEVLSTRIGADRRPGVFASFAEGAMATPTSLFLPDETGMSNLSLWEVTTGSDLSQFRVKKSRPVANTALMTLLTRNDFPAAHALAREIEDGRFDPSPWASRGSGKASTKSFVRTWLGRLKRRLRRKN
jgi:glycosyltransferase involved in cell wall biosynthesis